MKTFESFNYFIHNYILIGLGQGSGRPSLEFNVLKSKEIPLFSIIIANLI